MRIYLIDDDSAVLSVLRLLIEDGGLGPSSAALRARSTRWRTLRTCGADHCARRPSDARNGRYHVRAEGPAAIPGTSFRHALAGHLQGDGRRSLSVGSGLFHCQAHQRRRGHKRPLQGRRALDDGAHDASGPLCSCSWTARPQSRKQQLPAGTAGTQTISAPQLEQLKAVLQRLGLSGDPAYPDLIQIIGYLAAQGRNEQMTVAQLCGRFSASPKSVEQRIRRAAGGRYVKSRKPRHRGLRQRRLHRVRRHALQFRAGPQGDELHPREKRGARQGLRPPLSVRACRALQREGRSKLLVKWKNRIKTERLICPIVTKRRK